MSPCTARTLVRRRRPSAAPRSGPAARPSITSAHPSSPSASASASPSPREAPVTSAVLDAFPAGRPAPPSLLVACIFVPRIRARLTLLPRTTLGVGHASGLRPRQGLRLVRWSYDRPGPAAPDPARTGRTGRSGGRRPLAVGG